MADGSSKHQAAVRFGVSSAVKEFAKRISASGSCGDTGLLRGRAQGETAGVRFGQGVFVVMSASFSSSWALRNDDGMRFSALCFDLEGGSACAGEATRPETICPGTRKLMCWRVQQSTASKVGRRGAGTATASIEASLLAGDISDPPAKMLPFMLANELCRPPA
jgi:hypothetical protein